MILIVWYLAKDCFLIKCRMCLEFSFGNNSNFPIVVLINWCKRKFFEQIVCFLANRVFLSIVPRNNKNFSLVVLIV